MANKKSFDSLHLSSEFYKVPSQVFQATSKQAIINSLVIWTRMNWLVNILASSQWWRSCRSLSDLKFGNELFRKELWIKCQWPCTCAGRWNKTRLRSDHILPRCTVQPRHDHCTRGVSHPKGHRLEWAIRTADHPDDMVTDRGPLDQSSRDMSLSEVR